MLTPGGRNWFVDCQNANSQIAVPPVMDGTTHWNLTLKLLERTDSSCAFTWEWLKNLIYGDYRPLFTIQDECTTVKYVMEASWPFQYWTLCMSKEHTVTQHHVITVYNHMFNHMDGVMWALPKMKTQWKKDLYFAVKFVWQRQSKYCTKGTPRTGMLLISAHIVDPFQMLWSFRKSDKGMHINPEDETSYTTQFKEALLNSVENESCAKHRCLVVITHENIPNTNLVSSTMASRSGQSSYHPYDLSSDDEEYLMPNTVAETTPGQSDCAACLLTSARLHLNSSPELWHNWGQIDPILNEYHSNAMEISSTFLLPDHTDWWRQQEEMHSKYTDLSNVAQQIFFFIPNGVVLEASFSLVRDMIGWRESRTTGGTLWEKVVVR